VSKVIRLQQASARQHYAVAPASIATP